LSLQALKTYLEWGHIFIDNGLTGHQTLSSSFPSVYRAVKSSRPTEYFMGRRGRGVGFAPDWPRGRSAFHCSRQVTSPKSPIRLSRPFHSLLVAGLVTPVHGSRPVRGGENRRLPIHCSRQVWGRAQSLLAEGLNPNPAGLLDIRREGGRTGQTTTDDSTSDFKTTTQKPLPLNTSPDRRPSRPSPAGGVSSCRGLWGLGLPGKPWLKWSWRLLLPGA